MFKKNEQPERTPTEINNSDRKLVIKDEDGENKIAPSSKKIPNGKK